MIPSFFVHKFEIFKFAPKVFQEEEGQEGQEVFQEEEVQEGQGLKKWNHVKRMSKSFKFWIYHQNVLFISMFSFLIQSILCKVAKVGAPKAAKGLMTGVFALCRPAGSRAAAPGYKRKF